MAARCVTAIWFMAGIDRNGRPGSYLCFASPF
jgi:hypothetical protein